MRDARWQATYDHVAAQEPAGDIERAAQKLILAEMARLDRPLDEDGDEVHMTGSGMAVGPRGVVLLLHRRVHIWLQPGGHIDPGEMPWDAALRETVEETGLAVRHAGGSPRLVNVDVHAGPKGHTHLDLRYLFHAPDEDPNPPPGESQQVRWFEWDEALQLDNASLHRALVAARDA